MCLIKLMVKSREYYEENIAVSLNAAIHRSLRQCITTINAEEFPSEGVLVQARWGRAGNLMSEGSA